MIRRAAACATGVVLALGMAACSSSGGDPTSAPSPSTGQIDGLATYTDLSRDHVETEVDYPQTPPVGGAHDPAWLTCTGSVYEEPVRDENAVHSMEHGAVWVTYQPDLPEDQVQQLAAVVDGTPYSFMSPYPGIPSPVVLTAWGVQVGVDSASDPRVGEFVAEFANGPQTPEPGASCAGGVEMDDHHSS
jgi:hypothetical protein